MVELAFGLDLHGPASGAATEASDVGPARVVIGSLLVALAGWGLLAVLERVTARARDLWAVMRWVGPEPTLPVRTEGGTAHE